MERDAKKYVVFSRACEARALHTRGSRLRRFAPSENDSFSVYNINAPLEWSLGKHVMVYQIALSLVTLPVMEKSVSCDLKSHVGFCSCTLRPSRKLVFEIFGHYLLHFMNKCLRPKILGGGGGGGYGKM